MKSVQWVLNTQILRVREDADFAEIQSAYRRLVLKYHPDVNDAQDAPVRFRKIVEAYGSLLEIMLEEMGLSRKELIGQMSKDPVVQALSPDELEIRLRYSASPKVKTSAVVALAMNGSEESKHLIFGVLNDEDESVTLTTLQVMGKIGHVTDILQLFRLLFCFRHSMVVKYTSKAISQIVLRTLKKASIWHWRIMTKEQIIT